MELEEKKKEIVKYLLSKGVLLSTAILDKLDNPENIDSIYSFVSKIKTDKLLLIDEEFESLLGRKDLSEINWVQFEKSKVLHEKGKDDKIYKRFKEFISGSEEKEQQEQGKEIKQDAGSRQTIQITREKRDLERGDTKEGDLEKRGAEEGYLEKKEAVKERVLLQKAPLEKEETEQQEPEQRKFEDVKIIFSYKEEPVKQGIQDFVSYYNRRYEAIEKLLRNRQELFNLTSINRIFSKNERATISIIGLVRDIQLTKNNNFVLLLEDSTGEIKVIATKNNPDCYETARKVVLDEVIGIVGMSGENVVFANKIVFPDIPLNKEIKKLDEEAYAVFLSDLHVGSDNFLPEQFNKFIKWVNGEFGSEQQKNIASKVRYLFIIGDLVDGVGVYPGQEKELLINEINEQYKECARFLSQVPRNIRMIICAGNHDAMRLSEPQLTLYRDFAAPLWELPNTVMVSNPAIVNIASKESFPGFDVLMYHGYCFDYYVANVDSIRQQGGYDRADLIMKFLLQKRHLAPSHKSTLYIADTKRDPLFIEHVPDIFATGHIHKSCVANYRNIIMICGSCWQAKTSFQEKVGHNPEPARVPVVNLQTREVKILRF